jgi:Arc/MetJ-type ribon-helix-helix transcriptional regulator
MLEAAMSRNYMNDMNTTRVTVSMPTDMAAQLDAVARLEDRSASAIVRRALRHVLPSAGDAHAGHPPEPSDRASPQLLRSDAARDRNLSGAGYDVPLGSRDRGHPFLLGATSGSSASATPERSACCPADAAPGRILSSRRPEGLFCDAPLGGEESRDQGQPFHGDEPHE